jgi:hypothetical protein
MASANAALLARMERSGMGVIPPARGLTALQAILNSSSSSRFAPSVIASPFSWARLLQQAKAVPPVFAEHAAAALVSGKEASTAAERRPVTVVVHASGTVLPQVLGIVQSMLGAQVWAHILMAATSGIHSNFALQRHGRQRKLSTLSLQASALLAVII